jgi:hypothetical protein
MKKVIIAALMLSSFGGGLATVAYAAPQLTIQSEAKGHPNIIKAIHAMKDGLADLEKAPDDFGGNKGAAMDDTKKAIHSLRKALYFRLKMDDAAIDAAQD